MPGTVDIHEDRLLGSCLQMKLAITIKFSFSREYLELAGNLLAEKFPVGSKKGEREGRREGAMEGL